jgi:hypothetical protein
MLVIEGEDVRHGVRVYERSTGRLASLAVS